MQAPARKVMNARYRNDNMRFVGARRYLVLIAIAMIVTAVSAISLFMKRTSSNTNAVPLAQKQNTDSIALFFSSLTNSYNLPVINVTLGFEDFKAEEALQERLYELIAKRNEPGIYYWHQWDDSGRRQLTAVIIDRTSTKWANISVQGKQKESLIKDIANASLQELGRSKLLIIMCPDGSSITNGSCVSVGA